MKRIILALVAVVALSGCSARSYHQAVAVDYAFSVAVGVVDDAVFDACTTHALPASRCNTDIKAAMINVDTLVKAAATSLRALPPGAEMPKSVPDLLSGLNALRGVLESLGDFTDPNVARVVKALGDAVTKVTDLLYVFTRVGGA